MDNNCLAELRGVSKRFGKICALDMLDLQVRPGEFLALLGPNGAGKTTAISILLGLQRPDSGVARLCDRRDVGVMMQEVGLAAELRVHEHIRLVASYYPAPLPPEAVMEMTHTTALAHRPYGKLSGGQKRLAQFAMAICGRCSGTRSANWCGLARRSC
jgi:ABC-type multidrug transport system ATPase subunit